MANAGDYVRAGDTTRYYCRATQSVAQTGIVTATFTAVQYNGTDDVDTLNIHDPVTNNSQFQIGLKLGWWQVAASVAWGTATASIRYSARIALNGTAVNGSEIYSHASQAAAMSSHTFGLVQSTTSTDYVEIYARHDVGSNQVTSVSGAYRCQATLLYLGA